MILIIGWKERKKKKRKTKNYYYFIRYTIIIYYLSLYCITKRFAQRLYIAFGIASVRGMRMKMKMNVPNEW